MKRGTRQCIVCGKTYTYCPECGNGDINQSWKYLYDTDKCRQVFGILSRYAFGHIDGSQANDQLGTLDVSVNDSFVDDVKATINEIVQSQNLKTSKSKNIVNDIKN